MFAQTTAKVAARPPEGEVGAEPPHGDQDGMVQGAADTAPSGPRIPRMRGWNQPQPDIMTVIDQCDEALAVPRYRLLFAAYVCPLLIFAKLYG